MRNYIRFIPGEEVGSVEQWNFDAVDTESLLLAAQAKGRDEAAEQLKAAVAQQESHAAAHAAGHAEGHAEGYAAGYTEGFAQGKAQTTVEAQRQMADFIADQGQKAAQEFAQLFVSVQTQLAQSEQVIGQGVLELACELARQVLRRELSVNPNNLLPVIREALDQLVADNKAAVIRMNPLDFEVLETVIRTEFSGLALTLIADAAVSRGGCLVESAGTVVDGTLEKRWMRALATLGLNSSWEEPVDEP